MMWAEVTLARIAKEFISGGTPSTKVERYWTGDIPWITGADVTDKLVRFGRKWITREAVENSATHIVPKGAILLVTRTGVGKVAKADADIAISQDLTGIVMRDGVDTDYAVAAIQHKVGSLQHVQQGAIIKGVMRKDIEKLAIPLPPISEQRRIVEILDQADALRKKRAEADAKAVRILPALFYKMFCDPATNPKGWPIVPIGEMVAPIERRDPSDQPDEQFTYLDIAGVDGQLGVISIARKLTGAEAPSRARQIIKAKDVIVSTVRPYLRATALVPAEYNNQICITGFCVLRAKSGGADLDSCMHSRGCSGSQINSMRVPAEHPIRLLPMQTCSISECHDRLTNVCLKVLTGKFLIPLDCKTSDAKLQPGLRAFFGRFSTAPSLATSPPSGVKNI